MRIAASIGALLRLLASGSMPAWANVPVDGHIGESGGPVV
jgi:hypothetical protein